ncbi:hypothetical protein B0H14DRAFT_3466243 [Mycena olivaceomarginata]|nr:hypothetical protein B0H14DRAFT_3466243 [Mycena olivaceomarginata]
MFCSTMDFPFPALGVVFPAVIVTIVVVLVAVLIAVLIAATVIIVILVVRLCILPHLTYLESGADVQVTKCEIDL